MHLAKHKTPPLIIDQMGHTGSTMIFEHYREVVTSRDADVFWDLLPEALGATPARPGMLLSELSQEFVAVNRLNFMRPGDKVYAHRIVSVGGGFAKACPRLIASKVRLSHVQEWLDGLELTLSGQSGYKTLISNLFDLPWSAGAPTATRPFFLLVPC